MRETGTYCSGVVFDCLVKMPCLEVGVALFLELQRSLLWRVDTVHFRHGCLKRKMLFLYKRRGITFLHRQLKGVIHSNTLVTPYLSGVWVLLQSRAESLTMCTDRRAVCLPSSPQSFDSCAWQLPHRTPATNVPSRLLAMAKNNTNSTAGLAQPTFDFGDVPATPPAHIWAIKALRNGLLGTRPSPLVAPLSPQDDIDEVA